MLYCHHEQKRHRLQRGPENDRGGHRPHPLQAQGQ